MPDKKTLLGIGLGVAATLAAPLAAPFFGAVVRPLVKGAFKYSLLGAAILREKLAVALEELDDLVAEVKIEVGEELARKGPPRRGADSAAEAASSNGEVTSNGETTRSERAAPSEGARDGVVS